MNFNTPEQLNSHPELFEDPQRSDLDNRGPFVLVFDDFYTNPMKIRELALAQDYYQYSPPEKNQVDEKVAARFPKDYPLWRATSLIRFHGRPVKKPIAGFRYAPATLRQKLSSLTGEKLNVSTWDTLGDGWNGAFHLQYGSTGLFQRSVHHHYKPGDVYPRGWSGVLYLNPSANRQSGTSIWLDRQTGRCTAKSGVAFHDAGDRFKPVLRIKNRFNRLVLFRENVLHRADTGFGNSLHTARLTQTFFFLSEPERF